MIFILQKKVEMKIYKILSYLVIFQLIVYSVRAQEVNFDENKYYRLTNIWMGEDRSLDVNPDNLTMMMAPTSNANGQFWKFHVQGDDVFKLSTKWQGDNKVIDVINDGVNNRMVLAKSAGYSGQYWRIEKAGNGLYRLINGWQTNKCLDSDSEQTGYGAFLNPAGNFASQFWVISELTPEEDPGGEEEAIVVNIGDKAHGGIVFYVDESGRHGMVCQEKDLEGLLSFTEAKSASESSNAGEKSDWRLPNLDELETMYNNLRRSGLTHFDNEWYWSSEVKDEHNMWGIDLLHGKRYAHWEEDHSHVRAVRVF